jgi:hypothetical protein
MEATSSSEMSVASQQTAGRYTPEIEIIVFLDVTLFRDS